MPYFAMRKKRADSCYSVYYYHFLAIYGAKAGLQPRTRDSPRKTTGALPLGRCGPARRLRRTHTTPRQQGEYV